MQISEMIDGPIKMVTFDLYDTLIEARRPGWIRFQTALKRSGFEIELQDAMRAYTAGQRFFTVENGKVPIRDRTPEELDEFQVNLTVVSLNALDLPTDSSTLQKVHENFRNETQLGKSMGFLAFDEVPEVLARLRAKGIVTAVVSNADSDVTQFCLEMGFAEQMDLIVTSALVGFEKPDARTFHGALDPFGVKPTAALHVGDQPDSDVLGARAIGMAAALVDRYEQFVESDSESVLVSSLSQMVDLIEVHNQEYV